MTRPPTFVRPAILALISTATGAGVTIVALVAGMQMSCTALVEFGLLSAIAAMSAGALLARNLCAICGVITDYAAIERWNRRLNSSGYVLLGLYALANALLDLLVPRRDIDWISYPGLLTALAATVVTLIVVQSKYRVLAQRPSRSLDESVADDAAYLSCGAITLAVLVGHIVAPAWWLDTALDVLFVAFISFRMYRVTARLSVTG